jgi:hypothetical protein
MEILSRDQLIDAVQYGRMTPDDAEAEAARLGLGKLATEPDKDALDAMRETWWTLPMAVAWITWRTADAVCKHWDAFRRQCWDWHFQQWKSVPDGPIHSGHFLEQRRHASLLLLSLSEQFDAANGNERPNLSMRDSRTELWDALGEGLLEATAIDCDTGRRVAIPQFEWQDLEVFHVRDRDVLRARGRAHLPSGGYENVAFRRKDLMAIWAPAKHEQSTGDSSPTGRTGAPGRPSSMHLVEVEYRARWDRGEALESIEGEARQLSEWFKTTHPAMAPPTPKTIANRLRAEHRQRVAAARK